MRKQSYTVKNSFHNTEASFRAPMGLTVAEAIEWLRERAWNGPDADSARRIVARIKSALCGLSGCRCSR